MFIEFRSESTYSAHQEDRQRIIEMIRAWLRANGYPEDIKVYIEYIAPVPGSLW